MINDNKSYSKKVLESGVFTDKSIEKLSIQEKLLKLNLTRTTYYDYLKLEPLLDVLEAYELSKKQCVDCLKAYSGLKKDYEPKDIIKVITECVDSNLPITVRQIENALCSQIEQQQNPFNTVELLIKNHYHTVDIDKKILPIKPRINVESNKDMQLFAIAQWSINAQSKEDVKAITTQLENTNNSLDDLIQCSTPYELILSVAGRLLVGKKTENSLAQIFRASELLIIQRSLLAKAMLTMLIKGYDSQTIVD